MEMAGMAKVKAGAPQGVPGKPKLKWTNILRSGVKLILTLTLLTYLLTPAIAEKTQFMEKTIYIEKDFAVLRYTADLMDTVSSLETLLGNIPNPHDWIASSQGPQLYKQTSFLLKETTVRLLQKTEILANINERLFKRAPFEFIGVVDHYLYGQADPSEYRDLVAFMHENSNNKHMIIALNKQITAITLKTIKAIRDQQLVNEDINNSLLNELKEIEILTAKFNSLNNLLALRFSLEHELYFINNDLDACITSYAEAKNGYLNKHVINSTHLGAFIRNLTLNNNILRPPFSVSQLENYYLTKLASTYVKNKKMEIYAKIPLINFNEPMKIEKTSFLDPEIRHLTFMITHKNGDFRYLSELQYSKCIESEQGPPLVICKIRDIHIFPCHEKDTCAKIIVHDYSHNELFIAANNMTFTVKIICAETTEYRTLRGTLMMTVHPECELRSKYFYVSPHQNRTEIKIKDYSIKIDVLNLRTLEHTFQFDSPFKRLAQQNAELEKMHYNNSASLNSSLTRLHTHISQIQDDATSINETLVKTQENFEKEKNKTYSPFHELSKHENAPLYATSFVIFVCLIVLVCCKTASRGATKIVNKITPPPYRGNETLQWPQGCSPDKLYEWKAEVNRRLKKQQKYIDYFNREFKDLKGRELILTDTESDSDSLVQDVHAGGDQGTRRKGVKTHRHIGEKPKTCQNGAQNNSKESS